MKSSAQGGSTVKNHLAKVKEGYLTHLREAWQISATCIYAATTAFIHGIFPDFFQEEASKTLRKLVSNLDRRQEGNISS